MIIATVLRGKLAPRPSRNVVLSINGAQVGAPKATDMESGDATFAFTPSAAGIYAIKVYVVDFPSVQAVKHIMVEDREPTAEERELTELFRKAEAASLQRKIREAQGQPVDAEIEAAKKAAEIAKHNAETAEADKRVREAEKPEKTEKAVDPALTAAETVVKIAGFQADQAAADKRRREAEKVEKLPVRIPVDLKVYAHPERPAEEYHISVELIGEDKQGIGGWPLEIKDPTHAEEAERHKYGPNVKTGDDGAYRFEVKTDKPREIFISVVGTPLDYTLRLPGPEKEGLLPPPEVPEPTDTDLQGSLWDIAKRAIVRGKEDLKR